MTLLQSLTFFTEFQKVSGEQFATGVAYRQGTLIPQDT